MIKRIMFVCVGNICRSPMAEVLLKQQQPQLEVFSSGISNHAGRTADPLAVELVSKKKILTLVSTVLST